MTVLERVLSGGGNGPVKTYTKTTIPAASSVPAGTIIYVSDAPASDQYAISDGARWNHVVSGAQDFFGAATLPQTGLLGNLVATDVSGSNGQSIGTWTGRAGGNATQGTGSKQPTLVASAINNQKSLKFAAASSQEMAWAGVSASQKPVSILLVMKTNTVAAGNAEVFGLSSSSQGLCIRRNSNSLQMDAHGFANIFAQSVLVAGTWEAWFITYDASGNWALYKHGNVLVASGLNNQGISTGITRNLGATGGADYFDGEFAEIAEWNAVLSSADRAQLFDYVHTAYAL